MHRFEAGLEQQLLHERIADLDIGPLGVRIFPESGGSHRRAVDSVAAGFRADINHRIAYSRGLAIEDLVFPNDAERERIDQRVLRIAAAKYTSPPSGTPKQFP